MKLDYLEEGSEDCPLVRIYNCNYEEYKFLYDQLLKLSSSEINNFYLVDGATKFTIEFKASEENIGLVQISTDHFLLSLNRKTFKDMSDLVLPFIEDYNTDNYGYGYQWLDETSDIVLLLSPNGRW